MSNEAITRLWNDLAVCVARIDEQAAQPFRAEALREPDDKTGDDHACLLREREHVSALRALAESLATLSTQRGAPFSLAASNFIDWAAMHEDRVTAEIKEYEAALARAIEGPPAEDSWLEDAMKPEPLDVERYFAGLLERAETSVYWEPVS